MADINFGNFAVDMSNPQPELVAALNGSIVNFSLGNSAISVFLSNGTELRVTGSFDFSSESAFLNSTFNGVIINDGAANLVFSITGLPNLSFGRLLELSDEEIAALARNIPLVIHGSGFGDVLIGDVAGDTLFGNGGDDDLRGEAGNDTLDGGIGADLMTGGTGNDTYMLDDLLDSVIELPGQGTDTVKSPFDYVLGANFENLVLTGSDDIDATGNATNNAITGNAGDNVIDGGGGNDTMAGAGGNDSYRVDSSGDLVVEAALGGDDTVLSSATSFVLGANVETLVLLPGALNGTGNAQDNEIVGNGANNVLAGGAGNDVLLGGRGYDVMAGGTGNDSYAVNRGDGAGVAKLAPFEDQVVEALNAGTDTVLSSMYTYTLDANVENLELLGVGRKGFGNGLDNALTGNGLANTLDGGAGNDTLDGGAGSDRLTGGAGNDVFLFDNLGSGVDRVVDFSGTNDTIQLSLGAFGGIGVAGLPIDVDAFEANAGGIAGDAEDRILYNATTGALYYDADGDGVGAAAVQFAQLSGAPALTAADIAVIA